jgi:hypothetical protein
MFAVLYSFAYALILFALAGDVQTEWLKILGIVAGSWMVFAGAVAGRQHFRK